MSNSIRSAYQQIINDNIIDIGDIVHVGHINKGGTGYTGIVTSILGETVHFQDLNESEFGYRQYIGKLKNATKLSEEALNELDANTMSLVVKAAHSRAKKAAGKLNDPAYSEKDYNDAKKASEKRTRTLQRTRRLFAKGLVSQKPKED